MLWLRIRFRARGLCRSLYSDDPARTAEVGPRPVGGNLEQQLCTANRGALENWDRQREELSGYIRDEKGEIHLLW